MAITVLPSNKNFRPLAELDSDVPYCNLTLQVASLNSLRRIATEKGCKVRFHLADVFLPNAEELCAAFREEETLEGMVVDFSDSGDRAHAFAIIEVIQKEIVVVPVEKLESGEDSGIKNEFQ
jgi:hypothetical protein